MTKYRFSQRSIANLKGVHPDLVACVVMALYKYTRFDFMVLEGLRVPETQEIYLDDGVSWTLASKHLLQPDGTAHAVDLAPLVDKKIPWDTWEPFKSVNEAMQIAASKIGIEVVWGGNWTSKDGPHFQIMHKR